MNAERAVALVPYGSDLLENLAALMLERHRRELPDFSRHAVLFPHSGAIAPFRRALLAAAHRAGHGGVLAPWCGTLDAWLELHADGRAEPIDEPERDLLLLEALAAYPALRERYGTWALVDSLLALFDELNAYHAAPPADAEAFAARLAAGYGLAARAAPLDAEARLVYTLWTAWNAHLHGHGLSDRTLARRAALADDPRRAGNGYHIYIAGAVALSPTEGEWLQRLLRDGRATLLLHGGARAAGYHPDAPLRRCLEILGLPPPPAAEPCGPYGRFVESVYAADTDIGARARAFAAEVAASPLADRLSVFAAGDFEQEARAVELTVRRAHARGAARIGVVTPDRKLARRVRALLERANLSLRDSAGWALSTTSAATAVMRWIECVEQDFAHGPLLDFLKSPFVTLGFDHGELDALAHRFEEEIVRKRNVGGGLERYRRALHKRAAARDDEVLADLLDRITRAAAPLARLAGARSRAPSAYLSALQTSLARTGAVAALAADAAGAQVLAALRPDRRTSHGHSARLTWAEFHAWLQRELERRRFHAPPAPGGIELLDLPETRGRRFDALVVAGCTRENLPGVPKNSPFFNDGVRACLGLPMREQRLATALHDFRRLLEAAPRVLLTWRRTEDGEALVPSPWVERLVAFHRLAYGAAPEDAELRDLMAAGETALYRRDGSPLPRPATRPAPRLPRGRVPTVMSAGAHQRLLDCPYQFYVVDGLGVEAPDEVREEIEKSDYGRAVHRILHAFHTGIDGLPGPWSGGAIAPANRPQAAELLYELGRRVLGHEADRRLSARGWRQRWESLVPTYLDWQQRRARDWQIEATERMLERELSIGGRTLTLRGRADRIERGAEGLSIVDYKTGVVADAASVTTGEQAQLPFYALLHPDAVTEVLYVQLGQDTVRANVGLSGAELAGVTRHLEARLRALIEDLDRGAPLPAWGDARTCRFCRYEGLCRKEMWDEDGAA